MFRKQFLILLYKTGISLVNALDMFCTIKHETVEFCFRKARQVAKIYSKTLRQRTVLCLKKNKM